MSMLYASWNLEFDIILYNMQTFHLDLSHEFSYF